jgi:hypothetical protein
LEFVIKPAFGLDLFFDPEAFLPAVYGRDYLVDLG